MNISENIAQLFEAGKSSAEVAAILTNELNAAIRARDEAEARKAVQEDERKKVNEVRRLLCRNLINKFCAAGAFTLPGSFKDMATTLASLFALQFSDRHPDAPSCAIKRVFRDMQDLIADHSEDLYETSVKASIAELKANIEKPEAEKNKNKEKYSQSENKKVKNLIAETSPVVPLDLSDLEATINHIMNHLVSPAVSQQKKENEKKSATPPPTTATTTNNKRDKKTEEQDESDKNFDELKAFLDSLGIH